MTIEDETKKKNDEMLAAFHTVCESLDRLEPVRRARVLLAVTLLVCPQALTTEQVVNAFQGARLG